MELTQKIQDLATMTRRCLLYTLRNVDNLLTMAFLPVAIMLLFVYVLGGAMQTGTENYVTYAVPGILLLTIGYCAGTTAVSINMDIKTGITDRFRTMPIARLTILHGHVIASLMKNVVSTLLVLVVALIIGFRPVASVFDWLGFAGLVLLYTMAITWLALAFGLITKTPEGASSFSFIVMFLPYCSSAFVPVETMPTALRIFAENQPITPINESIRALLLGGSGDYLLAVAWCVALIAVGLTASLFLFKKKSGA